MRVLRRLGRLWTTLLMGIAGAVLIIVIVFVGLLLSGSLAAPQVLTVEPGAGVAGVPVSGTLRLHFSEPMNRRSVEQALTLDPPIEGLWLWRDDGRTLAISPALGLTPGITYTLRLDDSARSRFMRPLAAPLLSSFQTVVPPSAHFIWPSPGAEVPPDTPLTLQFSKPIVRPHELDSRPPLITLDPPVQLSTQWLDQSTVLIRPLAPLQLGQSYTATLGGLVDAAGTPLVAPPSWSFRVRAPRLVTTSPRDEQQVAPSQPLVLTFDTPIDPAQIAAGLSITPSVPLSPTLLAAPTTTITFTTAQTLTAGLRYTATLQLGQAPPVRWSFGVHNSPGVVANIPAEGQTMRPDQDIRLLFSFAPDRALVERTLSISPEVDLAQNGVEVVENEVRIRANFQAAQAYTLTLQAAAERPSFDLSFRTLGEAQTLTFGESPGHLAVLPAGQKPELTLRWSGVAPPTLRIYRLSRPLLLDALTDREGQLDEQALRFDPLQSRVAESVEGVERVVLAGDDGAPLSPGAYLVQASSDPLSVQRIIILSQYRMAFTIQDREVQAWAVHQSDGRPAVGLPLLAVAGGRLLASDLPTDDAGLWRATLPAYTGRLEIVGGAENDPAVAAGYEVVAGTRDRKPQLLTDRQRYRAGDVVRVVGLGFERNRSIELRLSEGPLRQRVRTDVTERISATLQLPAALPPGGYMLEAGPAGETWASVELLVEAAPADESQLTLLLSDTLLLEGGSLEVLALARQGSLPLAGAGVRWSLASSLAAEPPLAGQAQTDLGGVVVLTATLPLVERPTTYYFQAELQTGARRTIPLLVSPRRTLSLLPASRLVEADVETALALRVVDAGSVPASGVQVALRFERRTWPSGVERVERRSLPRATTDERGEAAVSWLPRDPGQYTLIAEAGDETATAEIWVTEPGFAAWPPAEVEGLRLVVDQPSYAPGAQATVLPLSAGEPITGLLTLFSPEGLARQVVPLRAGVPISMTLPITGPVWLDALLLERGRAGVELRHGQLELALRQPREPLQLALEADTPEAEPGRLIPFEIVLSDGLGQPISGTLALAFHEALGPTGPYTATDMAQIWRWSPAVQIPATGRLRLLVRLPNRAALWQLRAIAATPDLGTVSATLQLPVRQPIMQELLAPPVVRVGDIFSATAVLQSNVPAQGTLAAESAAGLRVFGPRRQEVMLEPGLPAQLSWAVNSWKPGERTLGMAFMRGSSGQASRLPIVVQGGLVPAGVGEAGLVAGSVTLELARPPQLPDGELVVWGVPALEQLLAVDRALLASRPADDLLAAVAPLLAAPEQRAAPDVVAPLLAQQNEDGGWGWTAHAPSDLLATDLAVRALVGWNLPPSQAQALEQAARFLRAWQPAAGASDLELLRQAALAELGQPDGPALLRLRAEPRPLSRGGAALLARALVRAGEPAEARQIMRLLPAAQREPQAPGSLNLLDGSAQRDAALLALAARTPALEQDAGAESAIRALLALRQGDGWGTAYETALALLALRGAPDLQPLPSGGAVSATLNGQPLLSSSTALSVSLPLAQLPPTSTLVFSASSGTPAYAWWFDAPALPSEGRVLLLREYLRPQDGQPLDASSVSQGAEVLVRLTLVAPQRLGMLEIVEPLPAGALLTERPAELGARLDQGANALRLAAPELDPGVYQVSYGMRLSTRGTLQVPAATLVALDGVRASTTPLILKVGP